MSSMSRRRFLVQSGLAALASAWMPRLALADPLGGPIGIQLYAVREPLHADPAGTLKKLKDIGFGEVETAGFGELTAKQFRQLLDDNGLACPSAHLPFDADKIGQSLEDAQTLGARYAVTGSLRSLVPDDNGKPVEWKTDMGADEAKRTAELANRLGEQAKRAGLQFAYHNHNEEFADLGDGKIGFDLLLEHTDPELVKFQIDCGWMVLGGRDPVDYFRKYPNRFPSIHVKDFQPSSKDGAGKSEPRGAELGRGIIDYRPIFAAAKQAGLQHYFVEQEGPFERMDQVQAAKVAYDYLHAID